MAQNDVWSQYKSSVWFLRTAKSLCWKSVEWQPPIYDTQLPLRRRSLILAYIENGTHDQTVAHLDKKKNSVLWKMMGNYHYPQWQPYLQIIISKTLKKLNSYANDVKNQTTLLATVVKAWKRKGAKKWSFLSKTQNIRHPDHLHLVFTANEQTNLQKKAGAVPMPLIVPNCSNSVIQQTIEMMGKNKEVWLIQDLYQFWKTLQIRKTTTTMGRLHISETIRYLWPTHYSIPLSSNFEHGSSISCPAATNGKGIHPKI